MASAIYDVRYMDYRKFSVNGRGRAWLAFERGGRPMADYCPLLIRAISRLGVNTPAARQSVYANARAALEALLLQDHSRIAEDEFDCERSALEDAIALVESRMIGGEAEPARSSAPRQKGCHTSVTSEVPCGPEVGAGRSEFLNDIRDDTLDFSGHDPERRMEALATIPGLPPVDARRDVPTRVPIDAYKRMPTPTLRRPGRTFLGGAPSSHPQNGYAWDRHLGLGLDPDRRRQEVIRRRAGAVALSLAAGVIIAAGAGFFVVAIWPPEMDFTDAPIPVPSETHLVTPPPFPQAGLPPIQPKGTAEGGASDGDTSAMPGSNLVHQASPRSSADAASDGQDSKLIEATSSTMPGSNLVHQASPRSSAGAASDGQDSKPLIEASVHDSSCFPSASAVRQDYPEAWPSKTLPGHGGASNCWYAWASVEVGKNARCRFHEGTKCWYAATRATRFPDGTEVARGRL
jgi:hypothetical protein